MLRRDADVLGELSRLEPRSTLALTAAFAAPSSRDVRILRCGTSTCTLVRRGQGLWIGYPVLTNRSDAAGLATEINRSAVIGLDGAPEDIEPLRPHLDRVGASSTFRRIVVPAKEIAWGPRDESTRLATPLDLPALEALFEDYELVFAPTARRRRRMLVSAIARMGLIVHMGRRGIDGAVLAEGCSPAYIIWGHMRVDPKARGEGISWLLIAHVAELCLAAGLGYMGTVSDQNPMTLPTDLGWIDQQVSLDMSLPDRWPGERPLRRALWRASKLDPRVN